MASEISWKIFCNKNLLIGAYDSVKNSRVVLNLLLLKLIE